MKELDCRIENVKIQNIPLCAVQSVQFCVRDICNGNDISESISKNDRALYIVVILLIVFCLFLYISHGSFSSSTPSFFLNDPQWCPL